MILGGPDGVALVAARLAATAGEPLTRRQAQLAARRELAKPEYHQGEPWWRRPLLALWHWFSDRLAELARFTPGGVTGAVVLLLLVVAVVVAVAIRVGPLHRRAPRPGGLDTDAPLSAADHRRLADRHAAAGEWAEAVRERLRAVVRDLEDRGVLDHRPGRTARELAGEASAELPTAATELRRAAAAFDEVWYGGRRAERATYDVVCRADAAVRAARRGRAGAASGPATGSSGAAGGGAP